MTIKPLGKVWCVYCGEEFRGMFHVYEDADHFCRMQWRPVSEPVPDGWLESDLWMDVLMLLGDAKRPISGRYYKFSDGSTEWVVDCTSRTVEPTRWMPLPLAPRKEGE